MLVPAPEPLYTLLPLTDMVHTQMLMPRVTQSLALKVTSSKRPSLTLRAVAPLFPNIVTIT